MCAENIPPGANASPKDGGPGAAVRKVSVFRWWDYALYFLLTFLVLYSTFSFFDHWVNRGQWFHHPVIYFVVTLMLIVILLNNLGKWVLLIFMKKPIAMQPELTLKVAAVTTIALRGEAIEMLEETVKAMVRMDFAHDTWVLDEEDDPRVKELCLKFGARHFSRKHLPEYQGKTGTFKTGTKYGNYNAWLDAVGFDRYDILSAFDPDHIPKANFLFRVMGYFRDPSVGYVQSAQAYYNQKAGFIPRGAAEETYSYYSSIQMAAYGLAYPIIVGSHNTHRITALKQVGGFAPHDADDLMLTLLYRNSGWQGVYLPEILARGLAPVDWTGYVMQQRRWARSVLDLKFRQYPKLSQDLSLGSRLMNLLHGLNYLHKSLVIAAGFGLLMILLLTGTSPTFISWDNAARFLLLWLPFLLCELHRQCFYLDWRNERGIHWRAVILQFAKWPIFLSAMGDVLMARTFPYQLTPKVKASHMPPVLMRSHLCVAIGIGMALVINLTFGRACHPIIYGCTAAILLGEILLILSERINFPAPFDRDLAHASNDQPGAAL